MVKYLRGAPGVGLHYKAADGGHGKWNQLRYSQTSTTLEVFTDASFAADEQCRSFGSVHLYWGGALVMWAASRQTLIAAHTAESELYSLSEGHLMGKALRPTVAALMNISEADVRCHLYCDNSAAIQLCVLEAGSWRTRHLRLRGAIIRQDLENEQWSLAHLDGVYMPADLGTKPVGPARLEDLLRLCDLWAPHLDSEDKAPRPSVAALSTSPSGFMPTLLALLMLAQVASVKALEHDSTDSVGNTLMFGFALGLGVGCGLWCADKLGKAVDQCIRRLWDAGSRSRGQSASVASETQEPLLAESRRQQVDNAVQDLERQQAQRGEEERAAPVPNPTAVEPPRSPTYEDIVEEYYAELRTAYVNAEDVPELIREGADRRRFVEVQGPARAPTVARPPGYPGQHPENPNPVALLEEHVYQVGLQESDSEDLSSSSHGSTTTGGAVRAAESDGGRLSSHGSGLSLSSQGTTSRVLGLAAVTLPTAARGADANRHQLEGVSWELWVVLGLVVTVSMLFGAVCMYLSWMCFGKRNEAVAEDASPEQASRRTSSDDKQLYSPVINITVTGSVTEAGGEGQPAASSSRGTSSFELRAQGCRFQTVEDLDEVRGEDVGVTSCPADQSVGSRGLGSSGIRLRKGVDERIHTGASASTQYPIDPKGLAPSKTRVQISDTAESSGIASNPRPIDPKGLVPGSTSVQINEDAESSGVASIPRPVGPKGLVTSSTRVQVKNAAVSSGVASTPRPIDPSGLIQSRTRVQVGQDAESSRTATEPQPVDPRGLDLWGTLGPREGSLDGANAMRSGAEVSTSVAPSAVHDGSVGIQRGLISTGLPDRPEGLPLDRFKRPLGMKQKIVMSCRGEDLTPFVYLTQNGGCLHSSTTCSAMLNASQPIQRSLCRYCFRLPGSTLPSRSDANGDRVVCFTRSGRYVHAQEACGCLDNGDEILYRKLCRCCRWGP